MSDENMVNDSGLEIVPNEKKTVEVERVWVRDPQASVPEIVATAEREVEMPEAVANDKQIEMPETVASENRIVMPEVVSSEVKTVEPEVVSEQSGNDASQPVSYAAIFAKYAEQEAVAPAPAPEAVAPAPAPEAVAPAPAPEAVAPAPAPEAVAPAPAPEAVAPAPAPEAAASAPAPEAVAPAPAPEAVASAPVAPTVAPVAPAPTPVAPAAAQPVYDSNYTDEIEEIEEIEEIAEPQITKNVETNVSRNVAPDKKTQETKPVSNENSKKSGMGKKILTAFICACIFGCVSGLIFIGFATIGTKYVSNSTLLANIGPTPTPTPTPMPTPTPQPSATPEDTLKQQEDYLVGIVDDAMKSVVSINVVAEYMYYGQVQEVQGAGSGIVVNLTETELLIATNYHVIEDTKEVSIQFCDGSTAPAEVKGKKVASDLAICSVKRELLGQSTLDAIKVATLGDSNAVRVGDTAIAIGNALGSGQSVTKGVISALNREVTTELNETGYFIQTDAPINHGNSGGALLNVKGEVIGINESKRIGNDVEGMGFAIPISDAIPIIEELSKDIEWEELPEDQQSKLGIVGVEVRAGSVNPNGLPIPKGIYINEIEPDSPAAIAGLEKGDIICEFNGISVTSNEEMIKYLASTAAGSEVNIRYRRLEEGQYVSYDTTVIVTEKNKDE